MLYVKKNKDTSNDDKSVKAIGFRDIYKVSIPTETEEVEIMKNDSAKPYIYAFFVLTHERTYFLFAKSE